jgi:hypothetical protein
MLEMLEGPKPPVQVNMPDVPKVVYIDIETRIKEIGKEAEKRLHDLEEAILS